MIPAKIKNRVLELLPQVIETELARNPALVLAHPPAADISDFARTWLGVKLTEKQGEALHEFWHGRIKWDTLHLRWGRKSGKTLAMAICLLYAAYLVMQLDDPHAHYGIVKNQKMYAQLVSVDKEQAIDVGLNYVKTLAKTSWYFKPLITRETTTRLEFIKGVGIKAQPSSARTGRGYPTFFLGLDEFAWFLDTNGNASGDAVWAAFRPNLAVFKGDGRTVVISSPAGEQGKFHELEQNSQREGSKILHRHGATWEINPGITFEMLKEEFDQDPDGAWVEYGARYATVVDAFIPSEILDRARLGEMPSSRDPGDKHISAVQLDPGLKHDRYVMARAYRKGKDIITEIVRKWQGTRDDPVDIEEVHEFLEAYNKTHNVRVWGIDQHQSAATIQHFQKRRFNIIETFFTSSYNQQIYSALREAIYSDTIVLPRDEQAILELRFLRRIGAGRNFKVEAPTAGRVTTDDCADAIAGAHFLAKQLPEGDAAMEFSRVGDTVPEDGTKMCPYCMEEFPRNTGESDGDYSVRFETHKATC